MDHDPALVSFAYEAGQLKRLVRAFGTATGKRLAATVKEAPPSL